MATEPIIWREPEVFAIGDQLQFQRNFPDYTPLNGWSIEYALTPMSPDGAAAALTFTTAPDSTNQFHTVLIPNFASGLQQGTYVFSGYLINGTERHQIYYSELVLTPNLPAGQSTGTLKTFNEEMVEILREKLKHLERQIIQESDVQRTRFLIEDRDKAQSRLFMFEYRVQNDNKIRQIKNTGRDSSNVAPMYAGGW